MSQFQYRKMLRIPWGCVTGRDCPLLFGRRGRSFGCDATPSTGYDALQAAGFITAGDDHDGPAFICRIGLAAEGTSSFEPTPAQDPCIVTPPFPDTCTQLYDTIVPSTS